MAAQATASCSTTTLPSMLSSNFIACSISPGLQGIQFERGNYKLRCNYATPNPGTQQGGGGGGGSGGSSKTTKLISSTSTQEIIHERRQKKKKKMKKKKATSFDFDGHDDERVVVVVGQQQQLTLDVIQSDHLPLINHIQLVQPPRHHLSKVDSLDEEMIRERVERIKSMLGKMKDGEITVSAYDTAWVALVEEHDVEVKVDVQGKMKKKKKKPKFPESLEWIGSNQLRDGSWGDQLLFQPHDRILNTLACVVALTSWNLHPHKCRLGMEFIRKNLSKLREEKDEHMPIGFEVAFPSLIEMARELGIHLLDDSGVLQDIYSKKSLKLSRIPLEVVHNKATTLLHSLEGMAGLNWEKLIKLQSKDGSFLFSPSSTAYALMQTHDLNCFSYLQTTLHNFNGGVPNVYPVDLFEHIWVVDRLQRLGISRFFDTEINACMDYVYRHWTEKGICWARNSEVQDIDDTAMGFRLLRLHGYHVSADVFKSFKKKDGEFICFAGQSTQAVTGMFNLYRASQLQYPSETILQEATHFSSNYLAQKQASNQLLDKWIIQKDLPGEVGYALDLPWYASLPRIETRFYIEQYGGEDDVWIGKTLYRMPFVNNNSYLELAKLDYNTCQTVHLLEWDSIKRWYIDNNLKDFGLTQRELLRLYFIAAASIFEPERSNERLAWAKTSAMVTAIAGYFSKHGKASYEQRRVFAGKFLNSYSSYGFSSFESFIDRREQGLMGPLLSTLHQLSFDVLMAYGIDIHRYLHKTWGEWMLTWAEDGDRYKGEAELVARTIQACTMNCCLEAAEEHRFGYNLLLQITNKICHQLGHMSNPQEVEVQEDKESGGMNKSVFSEVNSDMQRLLELVLSNYSGIDPVIRHSFLVVARAFYYSAYSSSKTSSSHLAKVLFERVK